MLVSFTLSMPNSGAWNGKWSGEEVCYVIIKNFRGKKAELKADKTVEEGYYHYSFGDGWSAGISVDEIDGKQSRKLRKQSQGFCGYDWMVESILKYGDIRTD